MFTWKHLTSLRLMFTWKYWNIHVTSTKLVWSQYEIYSLMCSGCLLVWWKSYTPPAPLCRDLQCRRPLHSQGNKSIICQLGLAFLQFDNAEVLHVLSVCSEILNLLKAEVFLKCHLELWSQRWVLGVVWRTLFSSLIYSMLIGPSLWQLGSLA